VTNTLLSRTNQVGAPWLGRSVTSGKDRQIRRSASSASRGWSAVIVAAQPCWLMLTIQATPNLSVT
jgi:hypothetical protein